RAANGLLGGKCSRASFAVRASAPRTLPPGSSPRDDRRRLATQCVRESEERYAPIASRGLAPPRPDPPTSGQRRVPPCDLPPPAQDSCACPPTADVSREASSFSARSAGACRAALPAAVVGWATNDRM